MTLLVRLQQRFGNKALLTNITPIRFKSSMRPDMYSQRTPLCKRLIANLASIRSHFSVYPFMYPQQRLLVKSLFTMIAFMWFFSSMEHQVVVQTSYRRHRFATNVAHVRDVLVRLLVDVQASPGGVNPPTIAAFIIFADVGLVVGLDVPLEAGFVYEGLLAVVTHESHSPMVDFVMFLVIESCVEAFRALVADDFVIVDVTGFVVFKELLFGEFAIAGSTFEAFRLFLVCILLLLAPSELLRFFR